MENIGFPILTFITFFPLLGALVITLIDSENKDLIRGVAFCTAFVDFVVSLPLYFLFNSNTSSFQFVEKVDWIPKYGISYFVGIDGISLFLILLTTFLTVISVLACWSDIQKNVKEFMVCLLFLETGMLGVFIALDLFLFYVFWEVMLIPMYLLIGVWGAPARRIYAAIKFFIYTMVGSLFMLIAILALYFLHGKSTGNYTFNLLELYKFNVPASVQVWLFFAFFLAFAIKVPMFPFHTWLPDAHTEAPTVGSVLLAGVLLKMGTYGFVRYSMPLFPYATMKFAPLVILLAVIGILYGAWVCIVQKDLKRLIAFSSVSHLGFVMLGLFTLTIQGLSGGVLQMINHGLSTGALFLLVGMIYERRHTRLIAEFGGLAKVLPVYAVFFMIVMLSSVGLPGLNGFIGEFLILLGAFKSHTVFAVFAATGIIFAAVYMLWMYQRVFFGEVTKKENIGLKDLCKREIAVLVPIIIVIIWIGVYPNSYLRKIEPSISALKSQIEKKYEALAPYESPSLFSFLSLKKDHRNTKGGV